VAAEAEALAARLAEHDRRLLELQDACYGSDDDRLYEKLSMAVATGTRLSSQLQVLRSEGEVYRRVQAELNRQRSRARLDEYVAGRAQ